MQANSESTRAASSYANNWGEELKIDIPQTGASVDQIWKLLRGWLGKETRISGEVISSKDALSLTARVGASPGQRFTDPKANLDALIVQAAELIYRETQPYRYAVYAGREPDRREERHALLKRLTADHSELERKWAYNGLAVDYREAGDFAMSSAMARKALSIDPKMIPALGNLSTIHFLLGRHQQAVDVQEQQYALPAGKGYDPLVVEMNNCLTRNRLATIRRSIADALSSLRCYEQRGGLLGSSSLNTQANLAWLRHDLAKGMAIRFPVAPGVSAEEAEYSTAASALNATIQDGSSQLVEAALRSHNAALRKVLDPKHPNSSYTIALAPTQIWPAQAEAMLRIGRIADAAAIIGRTPTACYPCLRVRGLVSLAEGDRTAAQRWFNEAIRQGPRLAPAYVDIGRLLLAAGKTVSAEARLSEAGRLAPNWPDAQKYWGDALAAQGRRDEAGAKYDAALKLAPKWEELRQARRRLG
jgi:tetratricopeptide (TPR) repeat protein